MTKQEWAKQEQRRVDQAKKDGYTTQEIDKAYDIALVMGRHYINEMTLQQAREELNK